MSKTDGDGPAFPMPAEYNADGVLVHNGDPGMSLHDRFLLGAFQGLLANPYMMKAALEAAKQENRTPEEAIGLAAHTFVNELMAQRKQEGE